MGPLAGHSPPSAGMPQSHRQTKPESNPAPRFKPRCPHCRWSELLRCHLALCTLQVASWDLSTEASTGSRSTPTQLHSLLREQAGGWGTPARSVKVTRTGLPAPADRQSTQMGRGPRKHADGKVCPHQCARLKDRPSPTWTYAEALIIACHSGAFPRRRLSRTATEMKLSLQMAHSVCQEISGLQIIS